MFFAIFFSLFILALFYAIYLGAFNRVKIISYTYPSISIVYTEYVGNYHKIGKKIKEVCEECQNYFESVSCLGIYYDSPGDVEDPEKCRATVGVIIKDTKNEKKIKDFMTKQNGRYQHKTIPQVSTLYSRFPYRNILSIMIGHIFKVLPKLISEGKGKFGNDIIIVEVYNMGGNNKSLEYFIPCGKDKYEYMLTNSYPPITSHNDSKKSN